MPKTYGTVTHRGRKYCLTSSDYGHRVKMKMPQCWLRTMNVPHSFLGEDVTALIDSSHRIIGWPEELMKEYER